MPYFEKSDGRPERAGKSVGDIFAGLAVLGIFGLLLMWGLH